MHPYTAVSERVQRCNGSRKRRHSDHESCKAARKADAKLTVKRVDGGGSDWSMQTTISRLFQQKERAASSDTARWPLLL